MRHIHTSQHGFSLVEVLVTVGVLAVGLVAMARFQGTVLLGSSFARERSEAVALAEQKIEQMRNYRDVVSNYDSFLDFPEIYATNPPPLTPRNCANTTDTLSGLSSSYTRTCTSSAPVTTANYSYITVTVRVTWSKPGASAQDTTVSLSSIITNANPRYSGQLS